VQTLVFHPDLYLDIGTTLATKQQACFCHKSQDPQGYWWPMHEKMHRDRGAECGVEYAEAYLLVEPKPGCALLPVQFLPKRR
jgi:LmbE family N-acetylglucosaminyl deacetylase